jgi:biotin carboxyl carrier protein
LSSFLLLVQGTLADPAEEEGAGASGGGAYVASMPATVLSLGAAEGAAVKRGDTVAVLESMKMEIRLRAHRDGVVSYLVRPGQQLPQGTRLLTIK